MRYWPQGPLVEVDWLKAHIGAPDVVILDCRFDLADLTAGARAYAEGHIPGALYVHLERDLSGPKGEHGGRHPLPSATAFAAVMGAAGVGDDTMVVAYDADASMAARAWWLCRYMGHDAVAVLDGGIEAWKKAGEGLQTAVPDPMPRAFTPHPRTSWVVDVDSLRTRGPDTVLLDARAPERYRGDVEPIDPRAGHIPGALSAFFRQGLGADGRWLGEEAQARRFDDALAQGKDVVSYCGSGVTACANLLALEIAGRPGARLYAGSFSDWASYPELTVATGEQA